MHGRQSSLPKIRHARRSSCHYGERITVFLEKYVVKRSFEVKIHKFQLNGMYIMLDINSGVVHIIDEMIEDLKELKNDS